MQKIKYSRKGQTQQNVGAIVFLIMAVGVATLVLIFVGVLGGQVYSQTEADITAIGGSVTNETVGTADANGYFSGYLSKTPVVKASESIFCGGVSVPSTNYTLAYDTGQLTVNYNVTACQNGAVQASYQYGDPTIAGYIKSSIIAGFKSLKVTGNYLPIVVLAVIIFIVLGLVMSLGRPTSYASVL